jgi:hypothetical protein
MIVDTIKEARAAANVVRDTKRAIQNAGGLHGSSRLGLGIKRSGYACPGRSKGIRSGCDKSHIRNAMPLHCQIA